MFPLRKSPVNRAFGAGWLVIALQVLCCPGKQESKLKQEVESEIRGRGRGEWTESREGRRGEKNLGSGKKWG